MADTSTSVTPASVAGLEGPITSFLRHLRAENKAAQAITAYHCAADGLAAFLTERGMPTRPDLIQRENVEASIEDLLAHRSPAGARFFVKG